MPMLNIQSKFCFNAQQFRTDFSGKGSNSKRENNF